MIAFLKGSVEYVFQSHVLIDVRGVGYKVLMPPNVITDLTIHDEVLIHTSHQIREDSMDLYGFVNQTDVEVFERLISVSGIGPKAALSFLATYSADEIIRMITNENIDGLSAVSGIGKKTAGKIILELKGKFVSIEQTHNVVEEKSLPQNDALIALQGMGFSHDEASLAIKGYTGDENSVEDIIKHALLKLGGSY